jgi:hypothetical protein
MISNSLVHLSSSCSLALQVCKCTISLVWPVFSLYIEGIINSLNLLGEASLVVINALNLVEYASFSFINSQFMPFYPDDHGFFFSDRWPLFWCATLFRCIVHFFVNFSLVHGVFFLSTICCMVTFSFVLLIPLSVVHDISPVFCIFFLFYFFLPFSPFSTFVFLFMSFLS